MQHQAGVKLAVLIFGVGLTPLGVNTKSKTARFGTFCRSKWSIIWYILNIDIIVSTATNSALV